MDVKTVAVVGAGTIGSGLAVDLRMHGYEVILNDITEEMLERAAVTMRADLKSYRMLIPEYRQADDEDILGKIRFESDPAVLAEADFIIENITEDYDDKARLYARLSGVCGKETLYGVNTSCISMMKSAR